MLVHNANGSASWCCCRAVITGDAHFPAAWNMQDGGDDASARCDDDTGLFRSVRPSFCDWGSPLRPAAKDVAGNKAEPEASHHAEFAIQGYDLQRVVVTKPQGG